MKINSRFPLWGGVILMAVVGAQTACSRLPREGLSAEHRIDAQIERDYDALLSCFPKESPGLGPDEFFSGLEHQPMTYGLIVSAEAARFGRTRAEGSRDYVRTGVRWLLDHRDLDGDHFPGWGLPAAWDAFSDGTINPPNTPYTITTAICLLGLLDALRQPLWTDEERGEIRGIVRDVGLAWCREAWSDIPGGGFFWFSPRSCDAIFSPNVGAMFLGALARSLKELGGAFSEGESRLIGDRIDRAAASIASRTIWRAGVPYWNYVIKLDMPSWDDPNDLVHHAYILWGMELYRSLRGNASLPWSRTQALQSVDRFWKNDKLYDYPQDLVYPGPRAYFNRIQARLWGIGTALAFYAMSGRRETAQQIVGLLSRDYGPFPRLRLLPEAFSKDVNFYSRQAAHVLWGLSLIFLEAR